MTGIGENTLAQPVKPPLRERCACLAKLVKNRLTLTDGIPAAVSGTVNGRLAKTPTKVSAIMGDFSAIKWGMVRDATAEVIEYGDPDNTGQDLKGYNQIAYRTEAVLAYAVLDPKAFAVLKSA